MAKGKGRIQRAATRAFEGATTRILAAEGRRSLEAKAARAGRTIKKAVKAGAVAGIAVAAVTVLRERRKHRKLDA